jgi:hypothetical protein
VHWLRGCACPATDKIPDCRTNRGALARCQRPSICSLSAPSRKEGAYQLSLSIRAVDYLIAERRLQTRKIGGRILIPHDELIRFARADRPQQMTPKVSASAAA